MHWRRCDDADGDDLGAWLCRYEIRLSGAVAPSEWVYGYCDPTGSRLRSGKHSCYYERQWQAWHAQVCAGWLIKGHAGLVYVLYPVQLAVYAVAWHDKRWGRCHPDIAALPCRRCATADGTVTGTAGRPQSGPGTPGLTDGHRSWVTTGVSRDLSQRPRRVPQDPASSRLLTLPRLSRVV